MTQPMPLEDVGWHEDAVDWIESRALTGSRFTADDLRKALRKPPGPNDVGAAFRSARTLGLITTVGYTESTAPSRRGGLVRVWAKPKEDTL